MLKFLVKPYRNQLLLSSQVRYFAPKKKLTKPKTVEDNIPVVEAYSVTNADEKEYLELLETDPAKARAFKIENESRIQS